MYPCQKSGQYKCTHILLLCQQQHQNPVRVIKPGIPAKSLKLRQIRTSKLRQLFEEFQLSATFGNYVKFKDFHYKTTWPFRIVWLWKTSLALWVSTTRCKKFPIRLVGFKILHMLKVWEMTQATENNFIFIFLHLSLRETSLRWTGAPCSLQTYISQPPKHTDPKRMTSPSF